jgi:hypothetical protein
MNRARNRVENDDDVMPGCRERTHPRRAGGRYVFVLLIVLGALATGSLAGAQTRHATPKPSPTPNPLVDQMENVVGELREINATLGTLRTALTELSTRLDRVEAATTEIKGIATPMREEVRGLYVETSNVRSEISRLEEKSVAEAESLGKSRYVLTLLLVATAVLQLVVLAVLLRSR